MKTRQRESGVELLRIFALFSVIMIHYCDKAIPLINNSLNMNVMLLSRSISSCAVDVFILISGFFMVKSNKRVVGKPLSRLIPASYYPILFVVLYIISPYINALLTSLSKKALRNFIIITFLLFSVWPTIVDVTQEMFDYKWFGLSPIGAWGNQQGFNIVNFILLYCIGAWLRLNEVSIATRRKNLIWIFVVVVSIFGWSLVCSHLYKQGMRSSWVYHNPLVIIYSVLLFLFFNSLHFTNSFVNYLAKLVFLCFLIHSGVIANVDIGISRVCNGNIMVMLAHYLVFSIAMIAVSCIAYEFYHLITKRVFNKLDNKGIPYEL